MDLVHPVGTSALSDARAIRIADLKLEALSTESQARADIMNLEKQERIRQTLRRLAEAQATTIKLMEQALELMSEDLTLDPVTFWKSRSSPNSFRLPSKSALIDPETLTITFHGRSCFLGKTLPFRLFHRLACRPNAYVSYEDLLTDVWDGERTDEAIRSVVKTLRGKLRQAGMKQLADAIDGSVPGHYALKLRDADV